MTDLLKLVSTVFVGCACAFTAVSAGGCTADAQPSDDGPIGTSTNGTIPLGVPAESDPGKTLQQNDLPILVRDPKFWETVQAPLAADRVDPAPATTPERHTP